MYCFEPNKIRRGRRILDRQKEQMMSDVITRGVVFVHSAPRALCPHVEWAVGNVLPGNQVKAQWSPQPAAPSPKRSVVSRRGAAGTGARIASALRGCNHPRYEATGEASRGSGGGRWGHTPGLGIFPARTDVHGDVVVPEDRIR